MPSSLVLCDTGPLIHLFQIGDLDLLPQLYGKVAIPRAVAEEIQTGLKLGFSGPRLDANSWLSIQELPQDFPLINVPDLGPGETEVISLALLHRDCLAIIDETIGRRVARLNGIRITGTAGVLFRAKQHGLITSIREKLDQLTDKGFWLDEDTRHLVLQKAGE